MSRTDAWRGACAAGSVTSIRVGSSAWLGSVFISSTSLLTPKGRRGLNQKLAYEAQLTQAPTYTDRARMRYAKPHLQLRPQKRAQG